MISRLNSIVIFAVGAVFAAPATRAAESYDGCAGFISSLPVTITTQGVWCLDRDLSTSNSAGPAVTIATNNVTVDCNGFKIGGLGAGPVSAQLVTPIFRAASAARSRFGLFPLVLRSIRTSPSRPWPCT